MYNLPPPPCCKTRQILQYSCHKCNNVFVYYSLQFGFCKHSSICKYNLVQLILDSDKEVGSYFLHSWSVIVCSVSKTKTEINVLTYYIVNIFIFDYHLSGAVTKEWH